jgi:hypothetical protein
MIFTHPITTSILTHLVLNMHELFYKQSLVDLDVNRHEAPLDPDANELGFAVSDIEWICDCPFNEAETLTKENGAAIISRDASTSSDPDKRRRYHTEMCLLRQQRLNSIRSRHNSTKRDFHMGYYRRPRARHLESITITFETASEDQEGSQIRTFGTVRGAIFEGMLLGLEVTTPGTGLTRTSSNHSSTGLPLFGATGCCLGSSMSRNLNLRQSNRRTEPLFSKRSHTPASGIGSTRASSTSYGHAQPNLLHPSSTIRILPSPPVRKLSARSGTISSSSSRRRSTITFSDDISTGPLTGSSYGSLATPMAPTTSRPKSAIDAPPLPKTLPVPRQKIKGAIRPLPNLPSLPVLEPPSLPTTRLVTQSHEQGAAVSSQLNQADETELLLQIGLSSARVRPLPLPRPPGPIPIRRLPTLPHEEEALTSPVPH